MNKLVKNIKSIFLHVKNLAMRSSALYMVSLALFLIILPFPWEAGYVFASDQNDNNEKQEQFVGDSEVEIQPNIIETKLWHQSFILIMLTSTTLLLLIFSVILLIKIHQKKVQHWYGNIKPKGINQEYESLHGTIEDLRASLKKAEDEFANKNAFISSISHDIRTQFKGITGFSKLLAEGDLPNETYQHYVNIINRRGDNLLQTLNNIILVSKIDSDNLIVSNAPFNLNLFLNSLFSKLNNKNKKLTDKKLGLKLILALSNSKSFIISDSSLLDQILSNLLDNAFKFSGSVNIEFGYQLESNQSILFFVKDNGIGIPENDKKLVYNRFHKVKGHHVVSNMGTGLGLSVCKDLVEKLDGKIWFTSEMDKGTTFYFTIPYIPLENCDKTDLNTPTSKQTPDFKDKVILIIEDDLNSYQFVEALLNETNARLIHAKNGEDGVEICKLINNIDLVLMDMQLPFLNGYEATSQIKAIKPNLTVIAQTAYVMSDDKAKCLKAGCDNYIAKPIDPDDFLRMLTLYLNKTNSPQITSNL